MRRKSVIDWLIVLLFLSVFLLINFHTIGDYGLTYDFTFHLSRGEAYLHYFLTGNKDYSDIPENERCIFQDISFKDTLAGKTREVSPGWSNGEFGAHPSLAGILSALGCTIFHRKLGVLGVIDAHHSINIILDALTILVIYLFALEAYGRWVALLAALSLAFFPRFIGHAHNNFKDIPILCFATLSIWTFWKGIKYHNWKWIVAFGIFFGLGMSVKFNTVWVILVIGFWLVLQWGKLNLTIGKSKSLWLSLAISPLIAFLVFYLLWPYLWVDPINRLLRLINFYGSFVTKKAVAGGDFIRERPWRPYYAPGYALITTPTILLFFGVIGLIAVYKNIKKEATKTSLLVILWLFIPILMFMFPKLFVYNGIRQFMGFIVPFCIVAAIGASSAAGFLKAKYFKKASPLIINTAVSAIMIIPLLVVNIQTHPHQVTYFNLLVGGLSGAQNIRIPLTNRIGIPDGWDYWGSSYREGVKWLNENAEPNSSLAVYFAKHVVAGANELREDIKLTEVETIEQIENNENSKPGYIMFVTNRWFLEYNDIVKYCYNNLDPIYSLTSQGAPVLLIYKY